MSRFPEQPSHHPRDQAGWSSTAYSRDQTSPVTLRLECEAPYPILRALPHLQSLPILGTDHGEGPVRVDDSGNHLSLTAKAPGVAEPDCFPGGPCFPIWHQVLHFWHVATEGVLEERIAIESAPILPDLHEPWPNFFRRSLNRDGVGCLGGIGGEQGVSWQVGVCFRGCGSPSQAPVPQSEVVNEPCRDQNSKKYDGKTPEPFLHDSTSRREYLGPHGPVCDGGYTAAPFPRASFGEL